MLLHRRAGEETDVIVMMAMQETLRIILWLVEAVAKAPLIYHPHPLVSRLTRPLMTADGVVAPEAKTAIGHETVTGTENTIVRGTEIGTAIVSVSARPGTEIVHEIGTVIEIDVMAVQMRDNLAVDPAAIVEVAQEAHGLESAADRQ